jgi:hypothetical protein
MMGMIVYTIMIQGGDINQDRFVETTDLNLVYRANVNGTTGYTITDLNGDLYTEIEDVNLVFDNNGLGVQRKIPYADIKNQRGKQVNKRPHRISIFRFCTGCKKRELRFMQLQVIFQIF